MQIFFRSCSLAASLNILAQAAFKFTPVTLGVFFFLAVLLTYDRICEKEPIGRELFRLFCVSNAQLQQAIDFLDEVASVKSHLLIIYLACMDSLA